MADAKSKLPQESKAKTSAPATEMQTWHPFESLHREIDRLFQEFDHGFFRSPFRRSAMDLEPLWRRESSPAVDIAETEKAYEITADLPGMDEKNIEVKVANGNLTIKGEKREEKEEKKKDYYLSERRFGSFERQFRIPQDVDGDKINAEFKKGVLKITLPKTEEARKAEKKIAIKAS